MTQQTKQRRSRSKRTWLTPLDIPTGKSGKYAIEHTIQPPGTSVPLLTMRNRIFGQKASANEVVYDKVTRWHKLTGPTGTWMTDLPVEQRQMEECIKGMRGRVLVGGLGLGLAAVLLAKKKTVKEVVVVEISQQVIDLVWQHLFYCTKTLKKKTATEEADKLHVIKGDLFEFLKSPPHKYNYAFFDIWQSDGEGTFFKTVCPLYELSQGKVKHPPVMWNEDMMRAQLRFGLQSRLMLKEHAEALKDKGHPQLDKEIGDIFWDWAVPFFKWYKAAQPDEVQTDQVLNWYVDNYGKWNWKELWQHFLTTGFMRLPE